MARDFRKVKAWEPEHALTLGIYKATARFPDPPNDSVLRPRCAELRPIPTNQPRRGLWPHKRSGAQSLHADRCGVR